MNLSTKNGQALSEYVVMNAFIIVLVVVLYPILQRGLESFFISLILKVAEIAP